MAEQRDGRTVFFDPQDKNMTEEGVRDYFKDAAREGWLKRLNWFMRIDNLEPSKLILDCVKAVKGDDDSNSERTGQGKKR